METTDGAAVLPSDWSTALRDELNQSYWADLVDFVDAARAGESVYPPADQVFRAFELSSYDETRVVILGQDPYHGEGQAHGLAFSVPEDLARKPPSLVNVLKELKTDVDVELPNGNLEGWARQGVLLLNTTLTVREREPGSHRRQGWETFTDAVIRALDQKDHRVVFILWGNDARKKRKLIKNPLHKVIESAHPSPFAAYRGFFGSRPFSKTKAALTEVQLGPIDWAATAGDQAAPRP